MTKKEIFIAELTEMGVVPKMSAEAQEFFMSFTAKAEKHFSDNAILIINFMQNNVDAFDNKFTAKKIGDQIGLNAKSVSSTIRKFINEGYMTKEPGVDGMIYGLTEMGRNYTDK